MTARVNGNWFNSNCLAPYPIIGDPEPPYSCGQPTCPAVATAFGNSPVGNVTGPGQVNTDLSIGKLFPVRERFNLEFRTEFFNVFNHPIFADPDGVVTDTTFGKITGLASNPRIIQFALKLNF